MLSPSPQVSSLLATFQQFYHGLLKMGTEQVSTFFGELLLQRNATTLSNKAAREHQSMLSLFGSAPGQNFSSAKRTLWGAVNAVTYYADHVRGTSGARLDSAWFGAGSALKAKAWSKASAMVP